MARIRTDYKPWFKVEYRGKQIHLPHDVGYVVVNRLGEVVGYQSKPRLNGDSNDPVAAEVTKLFYQGDCLSFEPEHKWVATDADGSVHAFTENPIPPELLTDEAQRPVYVGVDTDPAESFTMVTFKLPSKTVTTQEAMLTDEMFLAGVVFGMRLNKLLSKQGDSDVKEGS